MNDLLIIAFLIFIIILLLYYCNKKVEYKQINKEVEQENHRLEQHLKELQVQIESCDENIKKKQSNLNQITLMLRKASEAEAEIIKEKVEIEYENHKANLEKEYQIVLDDLVETSNDLLEKISLERQELNKLKEIQSAYVAEQQRKLEMASQQDYYRLVISDIEKEDISYLRTVQQRIVKKEAIDKVIWEVYYKPAYDVLMAHLFKQSDDKVCGIYKITCLTTEKAYIGQSVNIKERFREHIKTALSAGSSTNKLYQEMKKFQPYDFLFEVLEIVPRANLNERESYWIDFYQTKDFGLNKTTGNS